MSTNNEHVKNLLRELIDAITTDDQYTSLKTELKEVQTSLSTSIQAIRSEFQTALTDLKDSISLEIDGIRSQLLDLTNESNRTVSVKSNNRLDEIETNLKKQSNLFDTSFTLLATKLADTIKSHKSSIESKMNILEERTLAGEAAMECLKGEHEKLSSILLQNQTTPVHTVSVRSIPSTNKKYGSEITSDFEFTTNTVELENPLLASGYPTTAPVIQPRRSADINTDIDLVVMAETAHSDVIIDASGQHIYKPKF